MQLYHFTCGNALRAIAEHGLTIGDIPTDIAKNKGVCGVWFTTGSNAEGHGLDGSAQDKKRCRLTVEISADSPLLHRWDEWSEKYVVRATIEQLKMTAGNGADPSTWFIFLGWVKPESIVCVTDMRTGQILDDWPTFWPEADSKRAIRFRDRERWLKKLLATIAKRNQPNIIALREK